ncbi:hypothetical protein ACFQUU_01015 [Herbaspirillum sp. GCM10030257]|uniref:hypothetical protein n=1 Tax=Herbaspirillum sp. GCM10030257 TaxID=3273393 RepID=UPI003617E397
MSNAIDEIMLLARTFDELHSRLSSINVKVPPRAAGRKKEHVEVYSIVRLLGSLPRTPSDFPLRLMKRERPDFLLQCGARMIGVEHTEAISENAAKEAFLRSKGHGPDVHFVRGTSVGEPRKSSKQLISQIEADRASPPWMGDSVEREWAKALSHFIGQKLACANAAGFDLFDENWLIVYDNWTAPALEREEGLLLLRADLDAMDPWRVFSRIFLLDEKVLLEIFSTSSFFHHVNHCRS